MAKNPFRGGRDQQSLYENVEKLTGQRGNGLDRAITLRDLNILGLAKLSRHGSGAITAKPKPPLPFPGGETGGVQRPTKPTNLSAEGGFSAILVSWDRPTFKGFSYAEIYRGPTNNFAEAASIGTVTSTMFSDVVHPGEMFFYWVRFINVNDIAGPYAGPVQGETAIDVSKALEGLSEQIRDSATFQALANSYEHFQQNMDRAISDIAQLNKKMQSELSRAKQRIQQNEASVSDAESRYESVSKNLDSLTKVQPSPSGIGSMGFYKSSDGKITYRVVADTIELDTHGEQFRPFILQDNKMMLDAAFIKGLEVKDLKVGGDSTFSGELVSATGLFKGDIQVGDAFYASKQKTIINSSRFYVTDRNNDNVPLLATSSDLKKPVPFVMYGSIDMKKFDIEESNDKKIGTIILDFTLVDAHIRGFQVFIDGKAVDLISARTPSAFFEIKENAVDFDVNTYLNQNYVYIGIGLDEYLDEDSVSISFAFSVYQQNPHRIGAVTLSAKTKYGYKEFQHKRLNNPNKILMPRVQAQELDVAGTAYIKDGWALFNPHTFAITSEGKSKFPFVVNGKGQVFIDTAFISKATITELTGKKLTYDEINATLNITAPKIHGGLVSGSQFRSGDAGFGYGGPYDGYNTFISADGTLRTNRLIVPEGYISHLQLATGAATSVHSADSQSTNSVILDIPSVPGSQAIVNFTSFAWAARGHKAPVYGANFIVYDDKGREIYKKQHKLGPDLSYNFSMTTPRASTSGGFRVVISTSLQSRPSHGVELSISAMNSIR